MSTLLLTALALADPSVTASSTLEPASGRYAPEHLLDDDPATGWVEGVEGPGQGEWFELATAEPITVDAVWLRPGYAKSERVFDTNAAPGDLVLSVDGAGSREAPILYSGKWVVVEDDNAALYEGEWLKWGFDDCRVSRPEAPHLWVLPEPVTGSRFRFALKTIHPGSKYLDTVVSDIGLLSPADPGPDAVAPVLAALRALRAGEVPLAETATVASLPEDRLTIYEWKGSLHTLSGAAATSAAKKWLSVSRPQLFAGFGQVRDAGRTYVGHRNASFGDGEWTEAFPVLRLDEAGRIERLTEGISHGGSPGCLDQGPTEIK